MPVSAHHSSTYSQASRAKTPKSALDPWQQDSLSLPPAAPQPFLPAVHHTAARPSSGWSIGRICLRASSQASRCAGPLRRRGATSQPVASPGRHFAAELHVGIGPRRNPGRLAWGPVPIDLTKQGETSWEPRATASGPRPGPPVRLGSALPWHVQEPALPPHAVGVGIRTDLVAESAVFPKAPHLGVWRLAGPHPRSHDRPLERAAHAGRWSHPGSQRALGVSFTSVKSNGKAGRWVRSLHFDYVGPVCGHYVAPVMEAPYQLVPVCVSVAIWAPVGRGHRAGNPDSSLTRALHIRGQPAIELIRRRREGPVASHRHASLRLSQLHTFR